MRGSRRARLVLAVLLLTAFTLVTLDYRSGGGGPLRRFAGAVFGPVERAVGDVARPIGSFFASLGHLSSYKSDNAKLKREISQLQNQLHLTDDQRAQLADMEKLLHLDQEAQFRMVTARVIAMGGSLDFESTATIDVGSRDGVQPNMTVIDGDGLVGRTLTVSATTATVLLADDVQFSAGARLESSQLIGHVDGGGQHPMRFTLLDSQGTISVGERLVTLGDVGQRPFVPEVPIGRVTKVLSTPGAYSRTAEVAPYVNFGALDIVGVVLHATRTIKRDSLLPPSPTPTPSPTPSATATPGVTPSRSVSPTPSRSH